MPKVSTLKKLPYEIKHVLDDKVRKAGYGDCDGIMEWLIGKDFKVSRSTVNRYELSHKSEDEMNKLYAQKLGDLDYNNMATDQLLIELGALKYRESLILDRLKETTSRSL